MKFKIVYGMGGGYNIKHEEVIECDTLEDALNWVYESAVQVYESYRSFKSEEFLEEEGLDINDPGVQELLDDAYNEDVESWIHYHAEEVEC